MKTIFLTASMLIAHVTISFCQQRLMFSLDKENKVDGVLFSKDYNLKIKLDNSLKHFTPSLDQIKLCETYLLLNIKEVNYLDLKGIYAPKNLHNELKTYKRQYFGLINSAQDSIIVVQLLNFKKKSQARRAFEGWENEFLRAFDGFYQDNIVLFKVDLSTKTISYF